MSQRCVWTVTREVVVIGYDSPHSVTNIFVHLPQSHHYRGQLEKSVLALVHQGVGDDFLLLDTFFCYQNLVRVQLLDDQT